MPTERVNVIRPAYGSNGDGSDGPVHHVGTTSLARDIYCTTYVSDPGAVVHQQGAFIFATVSITANGSHDHKGFDASGVTGGAGVSYSNPGPDGSTTDGTDGTSNFFGAANGAAGGAGSGYIGGVGGVASGGTPPPKDIATVRACFNPIATAIYATPGSGSGGGDGTNAGGGAGSAGGVLGFVAPTIVIGAAASLDVRGGTGGTPPAGNTGGGGGGLGGLIFMFGPVNDLSSGAAFKVTGGAGGAGHGTGTAGGSGAAGTLVIGS